jgi:hypothetical protein
MHPWATGWGEEIAAAHLRDGFAARVVEFLARSDDGIATLVGARRHRAAEMLVLDIRVVRPQSPVYPINRVETVGVIFFEKDGPRVMALREDFPDTPHQNWMPETLPSCLCIDDRPWAEARATFTPAELLSRISMWFRRACLGELHDAAQPLDPLFVGALLDIILPRAAFDATGGPPIELVGFCVSEARPDHILALPANRFKDAKVVRDAGITLVAFDLSAQAMARMRWMPRNLEALDREMAARGLPLIEELKKRIISWFGDPSAGRRYLDSKLCLLFRIPIIHPLTGGTGAQSTIGFLTPSTVGEVGEALGVLYKTHSDHTKDGSFMRALVCGSAATATIGLDGVSVHQAFDGPLARELASAATSLAENGVLVGAGAIGSLVTETLVREGAFDRLAVIDHDTFLPHNIARHTLGAPSVGHPKAAALKDRFASIRDDLALSVHDLRIGDDMPQETFEALQAANLVIDASASVPTARRLSDGPWLGRRASIFFNPAGTDGVLLLESADRDVDLRNVEAAYHRLVQTSPTLQEHFATAAMLPYTGACRSMTSSVRSSRLVALGGLLADALRDATTSVDALVKVFAWQPDGGVTTVSAKPQVKKLRIGDWTVSIGHDLENALIDMRRERLPDETGGALLGVIDLEAKRIELVDALPAPPDSTESRVEFTRGIAALRTTVETACSRSLEQIRYVGEWHSHPRGVDVHPSGLDIRELARLSHALGSEGFPGLMLIVGDHDTGALVGELLKPALN